MIDYKVLLDHYYYKNYRPVAVIDKIRILPSNNYRIYLRDHISNDFTDTFVDISYDELKKLYDDLLIRVERCKILQDRNISNLVHFTKVDNLENILEFGIFSIDTLSLLDINYSESDLYRYDNKKNKISTSISYPNYKMFYKKRMEDPTIDWAIINIDTNLLLHKLNTEFYKTNAANGIYFYDDDTHTSNEDLENMFYDDVKRVYLPKYYTTDPQAEVLVDTSISSDYFTSIETLGNNPKVKSLTRNVHLDYNPNSGLFDARKDYNNWR